MFLVVAPGIVLVCVAVAAGVPAYVTLRESGRGRARGAVAYLGGFFTGIATTTLLFVMLPAVLTASAPDIGSIGLVGSFWGPFLGMARAKWVRPQSKSAHRLRPARIDRVR
jgi:hypothetical protein